MYYDLLIKIKNAQRVGKKNLKTRFSKQDRAIADILGRNGYVEGIEVKGRPSKRCIILGLKSKRQIEGCKFLSKPSIRQYTGYNNLHRVKGGRGLLVVSTSKGIMEGRNARKEKVGGELLFEVW